MWHLGAATKNPTQNHQLRSDTVTDQDPVSEWFAKPRLGLFLHFGLYAIEGWHEQDQMRRHIPRAVYEKLIDRFNPVAFDAERILDLAESVGMEYVCLTTKHHDGFCLWDTKQTDFNVMHAPCGRDLVGELAAACHRRGFALGLYYSVADWHHPNYPNQGRHHELERPEPGDQPDWEKYLAFLREQVRELCTGYGEIRHFFWDMNVPKHQDPSINDMIRTLQPRVVINNRGFDDGDFGTPERGYDDSVPFVRPTEACNSVGTQSWGYRADEDYYSSHYLIDRIDAALARRAHYLLNVGPDGSGSIPAEAVRLLGEIGAWYAKTREAFSDTVPCPELTSNPNVRLTRRANTLYVHLKMPVGADAIILPPISQLPAKAVLLNTGEELRCSNEMLPMYWKNADLSLRIKRLPRDRFGGPETLVIRLDFDGPLSISNCEIVEFKG